MRIPLRRSRPLGWGSLLALLLWQLAGCGADSGEAANAAEPRAVPVTVATVAREDVVLTADFVGQVRASREVEVRAQVGGILQERLYREGQEVTQGEPLFRIDPAPYRIALQQAEAELADARAGSNQAERDWNRIEALYGRGVVSERDRDQALSQRELMAARVAMAEARVAEARLNLDYSEVKAPLSGMASLERLPEGSLVEMGTLLAGITQLDPLHVRFSLPQRHAASFLQVLAGDEDRYRRALLLLADGSRYPHTGEVDFADSSLDPETGNVNVRAVFANPERAVIPGEFLRVRVVVGRLHDAVLVPPDAVLQGGRGPQVFVVSEDGTASARPVRLGSLVEQRQVILDGLESGERIVVDGQVALRDGMAVRLSAEQAERGARRR